MDRAAAVRLRSFNHFTWRSTLGFAVIAAAAVGFAVVLVLVRWQWQPLESADRGVAAALNRAVAGNGLAIKVLEGVTTLGGNMVIWWLITVGAACLLIRRQYTLAAYVAVAGAGALILTPVIKMLVGRLRPDVPNPITTASGSSFPSGHTLNATVFVGVLLLVLMPAIARRWRRWAVAVAVLLAVLVGFTRAALGVHYLSDIVGGWLLGLAWLGITAHAFGHWRVAAGQPEHSLADGLAPEAAAQLTPRRLPVRHVLRTAGWLVLGWLLVAGLIAGLGLLVVAWTPAFDEAPSHWFAAQRTTEYTGWSQFWSDAGNTHLITLAAFIVAPLAVAWTRRWRPAVFLVVLLLGEVTLFLVSGSIVGRDRPYVTLLDGHLPTSSFPSGHVAASVCLYAGIAVLVVPRTRSWLRGLVIAFAVFLPLMIALSRIYRGAHHPLDVTAGALLALLWLAIVTIATRPNADLSDPGVSRWRPAALIADGPAPLPPSTVDGGDPGSGPGTRSAVVVNATKVGVSGRRADISAALGRAGWPPPAWLTTTAADPGHGQTRQAVADGARVVFAAGGDGTVMACASALIGTNVALAVLPFGTGNLLARNLGLPARVEDAVAVATGEGRRRLDVGLVDDGRCFLIMAGMGMDAQMLHDAPAQLKARIGWTAYGIAAVRHLCAMPMTVEISLDHAAPITRRARTVLVANVGRLRGGIHLLPDAKPDDGVLDVAILMPPRRRHWLALAWALLLRRRTPASLEVFQASHVELRSDIVQPREIDGELIEPSDAITVEVRPGALWLCVPEKTSSVPSAASAAAAEMMHPVQPV